MSPDLVTAAVLGTDRREPPMPPPGPVAEFALESPARDAAGALVQTVAITAALDRAASGPLPPTPLLVPADRDPRPLCPVAAGVLLRRILTEWPELESEWLHLVERSGHRLSPDLVPPLLARHRSDPSQRATVCALAGPVADWLCDHVPALGPSRSRASRSSATVPLPNELAAVVDAGVEQLLAVIAEGIAARRYTVASGAVVEHLVAHVPPDRLGQLAIGLEELAVELPGHALVHRLVDLVDIRSMMHRLLGSAPTIPLEENP